jgi:hypothetical protein
LGIPSQTALRDMSVQHTRSIMMLTTLPEGAAWRQAARGWRMGGFSDPHWGVNRSSGGILRSPRKKLNKNTSLSAQLRYAGRKVVW